jgi:L-2,4-diaminobutyrate transaminase
VEFVADPRTKRRFDAALKVGPRIAQAARELGLIVRAMPQGDILGFAPPLVMTPAEVDEAVDIAERATRRVMTELSAEHS